MLSVILLSVNELNVIGPISLFSNININILAAKIRLYFYCISFSSKRLYKINISLIYIFGVITYYKKIQNQSGNVLAVPPDVHGGHGDEGEHHHDHLVQMRHISEKMKLMMKFKRT
jgi:hypothetical protein